ncbi:OmpA family protein [Arenibacter sp. GZD96]|uniref:OmpA family protein n=1 Tax=Aurantibrevibacter litoralis TaxID=3106030 RepID=UPI002AFEEB7D|nr:OmpA family protein [Arenibacter sp. GZD-96]MEA1786790.1 OmpA family protein [Arenibacter sp. GZD-96]
MLKKLHSLFFLLFLGVFLAFGQEQLLKKADTQYQEYSFSPAIDIYKKVLDKGFVSADLLKRLGNSYYFKANYQESEKIYKRLIDEFPDEAGPEYYFKYAQSLKSLGLYDEADTQLATFFELTSAAESTSISGKRDYLKEIERNSGRFQLLPFEYNTQYSDFAPSFYKEGLVFSSDRDTGNLARYRHSWTATDFLDLYKVNADSLSRNKVAKLENTLNTRLHESTSVFTKDGNTVYFTRNNFIEGKYKKDEEGFIRLKIFKATYENGNWTTIEELPFNSDAYSVAHPALSPDEKTLYFASDMPGTFGASDIFKVAIKNDGTYGTPENLGSIINTEFRETFPYVSADEVLYFSSDGHPGLGGLDIYATKIAFGKYTNTVLNVGADANSKMDDFTFIFKAETRKGYFASNRDGGLGGDDIYAFLETKPLAMDCNQQVTGTVRDKISNAVLVGASVKVINEQNEEIFATITDNSGNYSLTVDCHQGNFVRALMEGYVPSEEYLVQSEGKDQIIDFYLERDVVTAGFGDDLAKLLQLSTIYFDLNKFNIRNDAAVEIQKVIAAMEKYPSLKIKVNSHTDSRGPDAYNLWLSQKRAEATVSYMVSKGIAQERLIGEGFGETRLINNCSNGARCTEAEHQLNRRSEFIILE